MKIVILLFTFSLILAGCGGYLYDKPASKILDSTDQCNLSIDVLEKMLVTDAKTQIECLESNFRQFEKYVERENGDYISKNELGTFVSKFFREHSVKIIRTLGLFFKLNMLVLNDRPDKLSSKNIGKITRLLIVSNKEAVILSRILKETNNNNFSQMKISFYDSLERFSRATLDILETKNNDADIDRELDIKDFFKDLNYFDGIDFNDEYVEKYLFVKKLFVGGRRDKITSKELKTFIKKIPDIATLAFDLYFKGPSSFENIDSSYKYYADKIDELIKLLHPLNRRDILFTTEDIISMVSPFFKKIKDWKPYEQSLEVIKKHLFGGSRKAYTFKDVDSILSDVRDLLKTIYFNCITFDHTDVKMILNKDIPIDYIRFPDHAEYQYFSKIEFEKLKREFTQLLTLTRFYRSADGMQFFTNKFSRTKFGINESFLFKWIADKVVVNYGTRVVVDKYRSKYVVNKKQLENCLIDLKPIFEILNLWNSDSEAFARNILLIIDLFQYQSDGDDHITSIESSQMVESILTIYNSSKQIVTHLKKYCDVINGDKENPSFDQECYRKNFFNIIFNDLKFRKYFETLFIYYQTSPDEVLKEYLGYYESFLWSDEVKNNPVQLRHISKVFGAVIYIESIFIRFDINKNNILDPDEVEASFKTFEHVLKVLIKKLKGLDDKTVNKYALSIYKILLRDTEIPSKFKVWKFQSLPFHNRKISAYRINVARLLANTIDL